MSEYGTGTYGGLGYAPTTPPVPAGSAVDRMFRRPVVVVRVNVNNSQDEYGNTVPGVAERIDTLAYLEQTEAAESLVQGQTYTADWFVALPAGTPLDAWDRIEVPDMVVTDSGTGQEEVAVFEVVGYPDRTHRANPDMEHHVEANMRMVNA